METYDQVMDINVKGVWLSMRHEIPAMLKSGGGAIVNTSSALGVIAFPGAEVYVASKHAVIGLTKSAALEFAKQGIRINAVLPAVIETDMVSPLFRGEAGRWRGGSGHAPDRPNRCPGRNRRRRDLALLQ